MIATSEEIFAIKREVAKEMIGIIKKRRPLNELERRLLDALCSEIGVKYLLLPPEDGFMVEARQNEEEGVFSDNWF